MSAVLAAVAGGVVVWAVTAKPWRRFRRSTRDLCEVCSRPARYELAAVHRRPEVARFGGGSGIIATYCRRHRPEGSVRA